MAGTRTVLLVSADAVSLESREEQLRQHGFATRTATDADELQAAFKQQERQSINVAVVGAALPAREKLRITTILRDEAKRIPILLLADGEGSIVDNPDAVLRTDATADEFVSAVKRVSTSPKSRRRDPSHS